MLALDGFLELMALGDRLERTKSTTPGCVVHTGGRWEEDCGHGKRWQATVYANQDDWKKSSAQPDKAYGEVQTI